MGARFRLRAGFPISHFSAATQVVLTAMHHYGLILADNGSNWYFQGPAVSGRSDTMISELKTNPAGQFDAIDESALMIDPTAASLRRRRWCTGPRRWPRCRRLRPRPPRPPMTPRPRPWATCRGTEPGPVLSPWRAYRSRRLRLAACPGRVHGCGR
jgi:hypothetical protein